MAESEGAVLGRAYRLRISYILSAADIFSYYITSTFTGSFVQTVGIVIK